MCVRSRASPTQKKKIDDLVCTFVLPVDDRKYSTVQEQSRYVGLRLSVEWT